MLMSGLQRTADFRSRPHRVFPPVSYPPERRQHMHRIIEQHGLDMTHVTERKGSPQTLVCTKTRESYRRRCDQYRDDIAALKSLAKGAVRIPAASATMLARIEAASVRASEWTPA